MFNTFDEFKKQAKNETVLVSCNVVFQSMNYPVNILPCEKLAYYRSHIRELLPVRERINMLLELKQIGCKLILWSNRSNELRELTCEKLPPDLFDEFQFSNGNKKAQKNDFIIEAENKSARYSKYENTFFVEVK